MLSALPLSPLEDHFRSILDPPLLSFEKRGSVLFYHVSLSPLSSPQDQFRSIMPPPPSPFSHPSRIRFRSIMPPCPSHQNKISFVLSRPLFSPLEELGSVLFSPGLHPTPPPGPVRPLGKLGSRLGPPICRGCLILSHNIRCRRAVKR